MVDRLSTIEGDLRTVRAAPVAPQPAPAPVEMHEETPRAPMPSQSFAPPPSHAVPDAALGAAAETGTAESRRAARGFSGAFRRRAARIPRRAAGAAADCPAVPPRAISEILEPLAAAPRTAIAPELPPDHPLEPGTRPAARMSSPSERIAASESAISEIPAGPKEPVSSSSFIAAARRAAQAAAAAPPPEKAGRSAAKAAAKAASKGGDKIKADDKTPSNMSSKIRALLVGASVVVIVLGTFKMAMTLLDTGSAPQMPPMENSVEPAAPAQAPAENGAKPAMPAPAAPSMISPTPVEKQSNNSSTPEHAGQRAAPDPAAGGSVHCQRHHQRDPDAARHRRQACDDIGAAGRAAA